MAKYNDLTGKRYGRLLVVELAEKPQNKATKGKYWRCICDCGNEKVVSASLLRKNRAKSCGCLNSERIENLKSHGKSRDANHKHTVLYGRWANIKDRCTNPNCKDYKNYGGRGITICDDWKTDFVPFYNWAITNGFSENLQIDRKDNSKGYSPQNCHWVSVKENSNNRRNSITVSIMGCEKSMIELSEETKIPYQTLYKHFKAGDVENYIIKRTGKKLILEGVELNEDSENRTGKAD